MTGSVLAHPADPSGRWYARGWTLLAGLVLTAYLYSPVTQVMEPSLDSSNYASYAYFAARGFQYGTEVVPMYGPLGFVQPGTAYNGELFWARFVAQLGLGAATAALLLWFFHQARGSRLRWLGLALFVIFSPNIEDLPATLAILLAGVFLLQPNITRPWWAVATVLLGFLSLVKGTHLLLSIATLGVVVVFHAWQQSVGRACGIALTYAATFLICWLLAGQQPANIPAFLRGILALSDGYNATMALEEPPGVFWRGLLALALLAGGIAWGAWQRRDSPPTVAAAALFAGFTFVAWKHGFVRADGHIAIFHQYAVIAAAWWYLVAVFPSPAPAKPRRIALILLVGGILTGLWIDAPALGYRQVGHLLSGWPVGRARACLAQLLDPAASKAALDHQLAGQREHHDLPLLREEIGGQPVDFFGVRHGVIPLNGLNYRPRPMGGGSFNAYHPYLMRLNQSFLRDSSRRPPYYLMRFEPIDNRLGPQEDGLALLELVQNYRPVRMEEDYLLLKESSSTGSMVPAHLSRRVFRFGEEVAVPEPSADRLLVARFTLRPGWTGRLRRLLYKLPPVTIALQADGLPEPLLRKIIPAMAASPFLFSPLVDDTADFAKLYSRGPNKRLRRFTLSTPTPSAFTPEIEVEFLTVPRPAAARAPDVDELLASNRAPLFSRPPESIQAPDTRPLYQGRRQIQPLHAPGSISWLLDGTARDLVFDHGFRAGAYERGQGNGVVFIVELHPPGAAPQILLQRKVDPFSHPAERRTLTSRVPLPPHASGSRLVLRADPGEHGDNSWDWSYVAGVQLRRGLTDPDNPPVFNRAPSANEGNLPVLTDHGEAKVVLLHVPAAMSIPLHGLGQRVSLQFGFLPGAYTGDGRTTGADFVLELQRPGQAPREIFRRTLRPVETEADRGEQSAVVSLPALAADDVLTVRTQPVSGGSDSWGWTYFSRFAID